MFPLATSENDYQVKLDAAIEILEHQVVEAIREEFADDDGEFQIGKLTIAVNIIKGIKADAVMAD